MLKLQKGRCTNCLLCMQACAWTHERPQQSLSYARIHIEDDWPDVKAIQVCVGCAKKPCIPACTDGALSWDGWLRLDKERCTQCLDCVAACPFDGILVDHRDGMPLICDTCEGKYACVTHCPTKAIRRVEA